MRKKTTKALRCPDCRGEDLVLTEESNGSLSGWDYKSGVLSRSGLEERGIPFKVHAECQNCLHSWTLRGVKSISDLKKDDAQLAAIERVLGIEQEGAKE